MPFERTIPRWSSGLDDAFAVFDGVDLVESRNLDGFFCAAGPDDFDAINFGGSSQAEMQALVGAGSVAATAEDIGALAETTRGDEHFCANSVAGTLRPTDQFERHPVNRITDDISEEGGDGVYIVQHNVDVAVVEEIAKRSAPRSENQREPTARCGGNFGEFVAIEIAKK